MRHAAGFQNGVTLTASQVQVLYAYDRWANGRLLDAAAALTHEAFVRDLGASYSSVWETLRHILWSEWIWLGRWTLPRSTGPTPAQCPDLASLRARWLDFERVQQEFLQRLTPADLERPVSYENPPGTRWTYTLGQMLQHVVNHSTYHRGQVAAMLRQLGSVPPPTDYLVFFDELGAGPRS